MSSYVTLTLNTNVYQEIIDDLMIYCSYLDDYSTIEDTVHLIEYLENEYQYDMNKQDKELKEWQEYEKLFNERFQDEKFHDADGNINKKGMYEYMNFNKINKVLDDYKEEGVLDILDSKQEFFLVLDLIKSMKYMEDEKQ